MFLDLSNDWFMTVLKSPPIIIGVRQSTERGEKGMEEGCVIIIWAVNTCNSDWSVVY